MVEDRKIVKRYFVGRSQTGPLLLFIGAFLAMALFGESGPTIGLLMILGSIVWFFYNKFAADHAGEAEVDKTKENEIARARERALKKLNLVEEMVSDVAPVVVSGRGFEPDYVSVVQQVNMKKRFKKLFKNTSVKKSDIEDDPVFRARIGSDDKYRCSLVSISVFMFGEKQLYIYYSNVDLCTGLVYSEGMHEYFYSDVNAICFLQDKEKIYNYKTRKFQRILFECVKIYASGCNYTATLSTDVDNSVVEREFTGMRNLIRERKNAN